ncbi:MAG: ABC transporter permease [Chelatococcus sp.]|uniref:ABC transporter permease n=1 Tax=unclassified Chelatococcus TaxID=2638111 RepID=UPI001BCA8624|nr:MULTISPECIES: ABC transporter permease [unclassified Chelatococcus]CAH1670529.1 ABC transporter permease [Hyphomicrobiales bacterium]MBS7739192.1 ABC transporter permease [Chelatococcus sp. HY11]MBX3540141.1 ABC transporter permease [Chelatococcus sp.]MBX3543682.1 ABC transporter permease [Chelatococcus sp.]MCO5076275.1 ABC transporter permease [Chelatococcus sp.]
MTDTVSLPLKIAVGVILALVVAPLVVPVMMSVSDTPYIVFPPQGFTLKWYGEVLANPEARGSFLFSLKLAAIVTLVSLVLGLPCALGLTRYRVPGQNAVLGLILSPLIVPLIVTGVALLQVFAMLGSRATMMQLVIGHTVVCLPYVIRSVSASLQLVNRNLEDAAAVLGAPPHVVATRVVWPQVRPGILAGGTFCFIVSFDDYPISMWLADGNHFPVPLYLYTVIERSFDPSIAAIASLMIVFALLLVLVIEKVFGLSLARLAS